MLERARGGTGPVRVPVDSGRQLVARAPKLLRREVMMWPALGLVGAAASVGAGLSWRRRVLAHRRPRVYQLLDPFPQRQLVAAAATVALGASGVYVLLRRTRKVRRVRDAMTRNPRTVRPSTPVREAAALMKEERVGLLPVVEEERLVGVLSDRDLAVRVVAEERDASSVRVGEVASQNPVSVVADEPVEEALRLMARHRVRRLPVVEKERLVGVLAQADVAAEAKPRDVGAGSLY